MGSLQKTSGNCAVAAIVATAFLTSTLVSAQQEPQQKEAVEAKQEPAGGKVQDLVKQEPAKPAVPAIIGKTITVQTKEVVVEKKGDVAEKKAVVVEKKIAITVQKAAAMPMPAQVQPANLDAQTQQMVELLRPTLRAELRFLTSAADPTPAQRLEIAVEGARAVKESAKKLAEAQQGINNGGFQFNTNNRDPRQVIRDVVTTAAKKTLSPEQHARYQKERDARVLDHHQATIANVVANIDKILYLSSEQRTKLGDSLLSHWDDKIYPSLELLIMYDAYFPLIPDNHVNPILNQSQRTTWQSAQKINFGSMNFFNFFNNNGVNNNDDGNGVLDPDEKAAFDQIKEEKK